MDSLITKNFQIAPLLRIYYRQITSPDICVESVVHLLNDEYQPTTVNLIEACVSVAGIEVKTKTPIAAVEWHNGAGDVPELEGHPLQDTGSD